MAMATSREATASAWCLTTTRRQKVRQKDALGYPRYPARNSTRLARLGTRQPPCVRPSSPTFQQQAWLHRVAGLEARLDSLRGEYRTVYRSTTVGDYASTFKEWHIVVELMVGCATGRHDAAAL